MTEEQKKQLYDEQVLLLKKFLENGNISREQYEVSFKGLTEKMGQGELK